MQRYFIVFFSIPYRNGFVKSLVNFFTYSIVNIFCFFVRIKTESGITPTPNDKNAINYSVEPKSVTID